MHVTRILTKEHVLIKQVLDLLDESRQALETGILVPMIFFEKAGIFCSEFADRFHHFKEEFLLFGLLSYKKQGELDTAMGVLRYQHDRCRQCMAQITRALERYEKKDEMTVTLVLEHLSVYVSLLHRHIHMEDHLFFPMAEESLSTKEKDSLTDQFAEQARRFGNSGRFLDKHQALAGELSDITCSW